MLRPKEMNELLCDHCETIFICASGFCAMPGEQMLDSAECEEWDVYRSDKKHYCENCRYQYED